MKYFLGIDGGGTKTELMLINSLGEVIYRSKGPTTSPTSKKDSEIISLLLSMIETSIKTTNLHDLKPQITVFIGMSGITLFKQQNLLAKCVTTILPADSKVYIDSDALIALYSGTFGKPGIVTIAGTGSVTLSVDNSDQRAQYGGWGYLLDHTGSGYGIGLAAIKAVLKESDLHSTNQSQLFHAIARHLNIQSSKDLIRLVYTDESKSIISSLAPLVLDLAEVQDPDSLLIIKRAADDIIDSVTHARSNFPISDSSDSVIPSVITGGVMKRETLFRPFFNKSSLQVTWIFPEVPPVVGAVVGAINLSNYPQKDRVYQALQTFLKEADNHV